jgi:hypothetical protein
LSAEAHPYSPAGAGQPEQRHLLGADVVFGNVGREAEHVLVEAHETGQVGRDQPKAGDRDQSCAAQFHGLRAAFR